VAISSATIVQHILHPAFVENGTVCLTVMYVCMNIGRTSLVKLYDLV